MQIADLRGRLNMLNNKPKDAIIFYQQCINNKNSTPALASYNLARLYAKTGNTQEAFNWLQFAVNNGFNYSFVLQNDPFMDGLRKTTKWKKIVDNISVRKYKSNFSAN